MNEIKKDEPPKIFGEGNQIRDFVYVEDVAQANINAMMNDVKKGFFNVGSGGVISIKEIAEHLLQISKIKKDAIYLPPLKGDIMKSQADIQKSKAELGWSAKKGLKEWLEDTIRELER